jgi:hypothetical protein
MDAKRYARIAVVIFTIVALLQLARAVSGWDITIVRRQAFLDS